MDNVQKHNTCVYSNVFIYYVPYFRDRFLAIKISKKVHNIVPLAAFLKNIVTIGEYLFLSPHSGKTTRVTVVEIHLTLNFVLISVYSICQSYWEQVARTVQ
jgi:hypothetical protein